MPMSPVWSQPSASMASRGRLLVVPVAGHDRVPPHDDLAGFAWSDGRAVSGEGLHLQPGNGTAGGLRHDFGRVAATTHRHGAAGFGQAVGREDGRETQVSVHCFDKFDRHHGGPGHAESQRRQVVIAPVRIGQERLIQRRRTRQHADPLLLDAVHDLGVENRFGYDCGARHQGGQDARLVAEGVEERVDDEVAVAGARPTMEAHVPNVRKDCACVVAAPFGWPVVPEVKIRSDTSSGCTASARAAVSDGSTEAPAARNSSSPVIADASGPSWRPRCPAILVAKKDDLLEQPTSSPAKRAG